MQDEMEKTSSHFKLLAHFHIGDIVMFEEENEV
jgi:hypothetical protein